VNGCETAENATPRYCSCMFDTMRSSLSRDEMLTLNKAAARTGDISDRVLGALNAAELICSVRMLTPAERKAGLFPQPLRSNLYDGCVKSSGGKRGQCRCLVRKVEKTMSLREVIQADSALRFSRPADPKSLKKLGQAADGCT
jgi:hypothetical protein